jgi:O-antigen/teichoic acid export membrane protein
LPNVTRNLLGNFAGRGIGAGLGVLLIPVYVRILGVEAYGLVPFFLVVQMLLGILDLGMSPTINRQIAMRVTSDERRTEARDLLRTIEVFYWPLGVVIGAAFFAAAPLIAGRWLQSETLGVGTIETAVRLMGVTVALQWPFSLYENTLHGLQRIVEFNAISAGMAILRAAGAVLVLWRWPTITAFFAWQAAVSGVTAGMYAVNTWKYMPEGPRPAVRTQLLRDVRRFAAGMTLTLTLLLTLTYADRLLLSRILPLESFGYYGIATSLGAGLLYLMSPISLTVLPRFTELLARGEHDLLVRTYHLSAQLMTVVLTPVAFVIALFSREVMILWTRDAGIAERTSSLVSVLVLASLLFALVEIPYMIKLAQGRTRLAASTNLVLLVLYIPMLTIMAHRFGAIGAAFSLLALYSLKFLIWGQAVHTDVLRGEKWRWYVHDLVLPALAAAAVAVTARLVIPRGVFSSSGVFASSGLLASWLGGLLLLGLVVAVAASAAAAAAPLIRERAFSFATGFRTRLSARKGLDR